TLIVLPGAVRAVDRVSRSPPANAGEANDPTTKTATMATSELDARKCHRLIRRPPSTAEPWSSQSRRYRHEHKAGQPKPPGNAKDRHPHHAGGKPCFGRARHRERRKGLRARPALRRAENLPTRAERHAGPTAAASDRPRGPAGLSDSSASASVE